MAELATALAGQEFGTTIRPPADDRHVTGAAALPDIAMAGDDGNGRLVLGATIGRGGMGVVRLAMQTALNREVAVKMPHESVSAGAAGLLREAWVTGALEHPNVVPVHDLGRDQRSGPVMVLKRIDGRSWADIIHRDDGVDVAKGDRLERNLNVFVQVCNAIAFAHSRGIVHRDLKPANVMIGSFGEVYVLDWGIAVALRDDGTGRFPLALDATTVAGTMAYMAPEMLRADGSIGEHTDVYLLGAILYEIVAGAPPHVGGPVAEVLKRIERSQPELPADAPDELADIIRRAMAADPAARFADVQALQAAVLGFSRHRGSAELAREAHERLAVLERELAVAGLAVAERRVELYQLLAQCRFGFQQALRSWPDNRSAAEGLRRGLIAFANFELDQGDARAAALLIAELENPPEELTARLHAVERERDDAAARLEDLKRLEADRDARIGGSLRNNFGLVSAVMFSVWLFGAAWLWPSGLPHPLAVAGTSALLVAVAAFAFITRATIQRTAINRGVVLSVLVTIAVHLALDIAAWSSGLNPVMTHIVALGMWAGAVGLGAVFIERLLLVPALGFVVAFAGAILWPHYVLWAMACGMFVFAATIAGIWRASQVRGRDLIGLADR